MRKPSNPSDPTIKWLLYIPRSLADRVNLTILDPMSGKPAYGERNALIIELLKQHLENLETI
jgi:hypothetical protein